MMPVRKMTRRTESVIAAITICYVLSAPSVAACPDQYHGVVIDGDTHAPIDSGVVVVEWVKHGVSFVGDAAQHIHEIVEVLTDSSGWFSISACHGLSWNPVMTVVEPPFVSIFKPGYRPWPIGSQTPVGDVDAKLRGGLTIELVPMRTNHEKEEFTGTTSVGIFLFPSESQIPNLKRLLNVQRQSVGKPSLPSDSSN